MIPFRLRQLFKRMHQNLKYREPTTPAVRVAHHLAGPIIQDMRSYRKIYGHPTLSLIDDYEFELVALLKLKVVQSYEFGFERDGRRVVTCFYKFSYETIEPLEGSRNPANLSTIIRGATFFNYITYTDTWFELPESEHNRIRARLPIKRGNNSPPQDGSGFWKNQESFISKGAALDRRSYQSPN